MSDSEAAALDPGAPEGEPPPSRRLSIDHDLGIGAMVPVVLVNIVLNILTLTFYRFWAKTRIRRMLWAGTVVEGDRPEYTGTGLELLIGFVIVVVVVLVPLAGFKMAVDSYIGMENPLLAGAITSPLYLLILYLIGVATYRAQRYRLSRTRWRGIRPALDGSSWLYGLLYAAIYLLSGATLGWTYPWGRMRLFRQMMSATEFGDRRFRFEGTAGVLYPRFALCWLLSVPVGSLAVFLVFAVAGGMAAVFSPDGELVEGIEAWATILALLIPLSLLALPPLWVIYKRREYEYFVECLSYEGLSFRLGASYLSFLWLIVGNALILLFTLTLGRAFAQLRLFRYVCGRLEIVGEIDFEAIRQSARERPRSGEGLADAFDVASI